MKLLTKFWLAAAWVLLVIMLLEYLVFHDNPAALGAGISMWFSFGVWTILLELEGRLRK